MTPVPAASTCSRAFLYLLLGILLCAVQTSICSPAFSVFLCPARLPATTPPRGRRIGAGCPSRPARLRGGAGVVGADPAVGVVVEDLRAAARVAKGRKVADGVRLLVSPASKEIVGRIVKDGTFSVLLDAGALITNPGCSACAGDGGAMADGDSRAFFVMTLGRLGRPQAA